MKFPISVIICMVILEVECQFYTKLEGMYPEISKICDSRTACLLQCSLDGANCKGILEESNGNYATVSRLLASGASTKSIYLKVSMFAKILVVGGMVKGIHNFDTYIPKKSVEIISIIPGEICKGGVNIDLPFATLSSTGQVFQGKPTVCGGWGTRKYINCNKCYAYDPIGRKWKTLPNMLYPQGWGGSAISNGRLFIMASWIQTNTQLFDGVKWRAGTNAGIAPSRSCGVQLDEDKSMMTGGGGVNNQRKTYIYSRSTNKWTPGPDMRVRHYDHACVTMLDGRVMVVGGHYHPTVTEILNPVTMKWTRMPDSTVSFNQAYLVIAGGVPVITGGDGTSLKGVYKWENNIWNKLNIELSTKRIKHTAFPLDANVEC